MKIAFINSMEKSVYEVDRFLEVAEKQGHEVVALSIKEPLLCQVNKDMRCLTKEVAVSLHQFDAAFLKLGIAYFEAGQILGTSFENLGVPCFNSPRSLYLTRNKFLCLSLLAQKGFPVPVSLFMPSKKNVAEVFGKAEKVVVKTNQGSGGVGVFLAENRAHVHALQDYLYVKNEPYFVQEYIDGSFGEDIRVFVLGQTILGAIRRRSQDVQEFRSNLFLGGIAEPVSLTNEEKEMALNSASSLGLSLAGVDIIRGKDQIYLLEVNGNPGFKGIEETHDLCVSSKILSFMEERLNT